MKANKSTVLAAALAAVFSLPTAVFADSPEDIPDHTVRNIRLSVLAADALVVATVMKAPGEGPHAKVIFKVDQAVMGQVPETLETSLEGFYAKELEEGTQLLVAFKRKGKDRFVCTGRYERVTEGRIRDHSLDAYLGAMTAEIAKVQSERALANKGAATPKAESIATNSGT
jgi:hypothetical protein